MDEGYINTFFNNNIGEDLSYIWNEERQELKLELIINAIYKYVKSGNVEISRESIENLYKKVEYEFLEKINLDECK
jgi:hypothetical protein